MIRWFQCLSSNLKAQVRKRAALEQRIAKDKKGCSGEVRLCQVINKVIFQTVEISKKYTELHAEYADDIYAAMQASVKDGSPVIAPLWWLDPHDNVTFDIWDGKPSNTCRLRAHILAFLTSTR